MFRSLILLAAASLIPISGIAAPVTYSVVTGNVNATAQFSISGTTLTLVLTNNSPASVPSDVFGSFFFDLSGNPVLTGFDADSTTGSCPTSNPSCAGTIDLKAPPAGSLQGGWQYLSGNPLSGVSQHYGVGTVGLGIFSGNNVNSGGQGGNFDYGLAAGKSNPNTPVAASNLLNKSATFTWTLPQSGLTESIVSNVRFQFGTSLTEPSYSCAGPNSGACTDPGTPTPEPSTFVLMGIGLTAATVWAKRRR